MKRLEPVALARRHDAHRRSFLLSAVAASVLCCAAGGVQTITVPVPPAPRSDGFTMGRSQRPDGMTLTLDSDSLRLNGNPWIPVMGEFHYARYPEDEWREELLKMKAGGVDTVATYVFWIHHEEVEGQFDWSGRRNLRRFIETARDVGLNAVVRCGPWCHGEVRNGGLPDWILTKGWKTRSNDERYLAKVRILYGEIARQLDGLLWKDGGPVLGIQLENEYNGPAEHLLTLKRLAREAGLDVPLYTRTGWPELRSPMPFGEIVPLYGVYAEGFWDRELTPMPGRYWAGFHFSTLRSDSNIANELLGRRNAKDAADAARYPYLTCEIGGGMMSSYHRRILIDPADIEATTLVKLGSGSTSLGYYMYHGGVNPDGKLTTLMESQATGFWNDMPVKGYDFQAPLGQYGQIRPQYHLLRRLHLFVHDWGAALAHMPAVMPDQRPTGSGDAETLRWCVRSDGTTGFVFVNNYQRLQQLPAKKDIQFAIRLPAETLTFPDKPITIPAASRFIWPFNLDLAPGVRLSWATAQPLCAVDSGNQRTVFFAETKGVAPTFAFDHCSEPKTFSGRVTTTDDALLVQSVTPGRAPAIEFAGSDKIVRIVVLSESDSLALWKAPWRGRDRVFLTRAGLVVDGDAVRLTSSDPTVLQVGICPFSQDLESASGKVKRTSDGVFETFTPARPSPLAANAVVESVRAPGPPRKISLGRIEKPVAAAPEDADFESAAEWRIRLPADLDLSDDPVLRLRYIGDVARATLNGKLLTDDIYNGNDLEVGLRRHARAILTGDLRVLILPLPTNAPVYLASEAKAAFEGSPHRAELRSVEIVPRYQVQSGTWDR